MTPPRWLALRPWRRHSLVLLVAGAVYVMIGFSYCFTSPPASRESALRVALSLLPLPTWGVIFIVVGTLAITSARWPPASETWGYTALTALSVLWAMFYACGIALGASVSTFSGALVWALVGFLWWAISGLRNPQDLPAPTGKE